MVDFIIGRSGSRKSHYLRKDILENINKSTTENLILIVPEQYTLQAERDFLEGTNLDGILSLEVLSFQRLIHKILSEVGGLHKQDINDLGKMMILRRLFSKCYDDIKIFKQVIKREGFLKNINYILTELKKNDISSSDLQKYRKTIENPILRSKLDDIILIYQNYNIFLKGKYEDQEDKFHLAISQVEKSKYLSHSKIWLDGFSGFTELEYHIIDELIKKTDNITFCLTLDMNLIDNDRVAIDRTNDYKLFEPVQEVYKRLKELSEKNGKKVRNIELKSNIAYRDLSHLEKEIYSFPYHPYSGSTDHIKLFQASNQYQEVENAAKQMVRLVRDKGYRWREIAVVTGDISLYNLNIRRVFEEYKIPYFFDEKRSIINNSIVRCVLSCLQIINGNFRYEDVFSYLKTGFGPVERAAIEKLENYTLEFGIEGKSWFKNFNMKTDDYNLNELNKYRKLIISPFIDLVQGIQKSETVGEYTSFLIKFLQDINLQVRINKWINQLKESGQLEYVNENSQIWNTIVEIFEQLMEIMGEEKINFNEYITILQTGFIEYELGIIPSTLDQVLVGSPDRSRSHDIKALFLIGLNDGVLPSITEDDGILLDDEKIQLKSMGLKLTSDSVSRGQEEQLNIYSTITRPTEFLWLSFSDSDLEGKALRPSLLIKIISKLFPDIERMSNQDTLDIIGGHSSEDNVKETLNNITLPGSTLKYLLSKLREYAKTGEMSDYWWGVLYWYYQERYWAKRLDIVIEGLFHSNQQEYLFQAIDNQEMILDKIGKLYKLPLKTSISRLQQYSKCPFAHFLNYALRPKERKKYKLEALDFGNVYHQIIEEYGKYLRENNLQWYDVKFDQNEIIIDQIVSNVIEGFSNSIFYSSNRYSYLVNKIKRVVKRAVRVLKYHLKNSEFRPVFYELAFSENGDTAPLTIPLDNKNNMIIEGRIDRVDMAVKDEQVYLKVIDYKSGSKKFALNELYYGLELQLIIYMAALLKNKQFLLSALQKHIINKKIEEIIPAGFFYFHIDDPMIKGEKLDNSQIQEEIIKKLKLDGLVIDQGNSIKLLDKNLEKSASSDIIPLRINKDGSLSKNSSALAYQHLELLIEHVVYKLKEIGRDIFKGKIRVEPVKVSNKYTACDYCPYDAICQFDPQIKDNEYRDLGDLNNQEIIQKLSYKAEMEREYNEMDS